MQSTVDPVNLRHIQSIVRETVATNRQSIMHNQPNNLQSDRHYPRCTNATEPMTSRHRYKTRRMDDPTDSFSTSKTTTAPRPHDPLHARIIHQRQCQSQRACEADAVGLIAHARNPPLHLNGHVFPQSTAQPSQSSLSISDIAAQTVQQKALFFAKKTVFRMQLCFII